MASLQQQVSNLRAETVYLFRKCDSLTHDIVQSRNQFAEVEERLTQEVAQLRSKLEARSDSSGQIGPSDENNASLENVLDLSSLSAAYCQNSGPEDEPLRNA